MLLFPFYITRFPLIAMRFVLISTWKWLNSNRLSSNINKQNLLPTATTDLCAVMPFITLQYYIYFLSCPSLYLQYSQYFNHAALLFEEFNHSASKLFMYFCYNAHIEIGNSTIINFNSVNIFLEFIFMWNTGEAQLQTLCIFYLSPCLFYRRTFLKSI